MRFIVLLYCLFSHVSLACAQQSDIVPGDKLSLDDCIAIVYQLALAAIDKSEGLLGQRYSK